MPTQPPKERRSALSSVGKIATYTALAVGTYQIASWAYNTYIKSDDDDEELGLIGAISNTVRSVLEEEFPSARRTPGAPARPPLTTNQFRVRRQRLTRCRDESCKALEGFFTTVRRIIDERTDTTAATKALKKLRAERDDPNVDEAKHKQQEAELWNTIKIRSITRMMATAYAHTILFLVLTVQVNLLGGHLFEEQIGKDQASLSSEQSDESGGSKIDNYQASHRFVLAHTYEYFFEQGLAGLVSAVERAVTEIADWNVLDTNSLKMTRERFDDGIQKIRASLEEGRSKSRTRCLMRFLMPPSANLEVEIKDVLAREILDETWDLVESPVLADAQKDCLATTFGLMRDREWGTLFEIDGGEPSSPLDSTYTAKPLATVLTRLKKTSASFYEATDNAVNIYCAAVATLPSVLELADVSFN